MYVSERSKDIFYCSWPLIIVRSPYCVFACLSRPGDVPDLKVFHVGTDVPSLQKKSKSVDGSLTFAFLTDTEECVEFIAITRRQVG